MAKHVMSMAQVRNKTSQEGFDLSRFNRFTAREGALQPVFWLEMMPKDDFTIDIKWRTNTTPMQTAAYVTIKENLDVFFVPYHILFGDFEAWKSQVDIDNYSTGYLTGSNITPDVPIPWCTSVDIISVVQSAFAQDLSDNFESRKFSRFSCNEIGELWRRVPDIFRLLNLLDYGTFAPSWKVVSSGVAGSTSYSWEPLPDNNIQSVGDNAVKQFLLKPLNLFPLFSYQKIYQDFYRRTQWELSSPWTYNVDWMRSSPGSDKTHYIPNSIFFPIVNEPDWVPTPFDLHYASYGDDLFMSLLPRPQYGNDSVVPVDAVGDVFSDSLGTPVTSTEKGLSILALRQGQALQKWKEVSLANDMDYVSQVEAHYGIKLPACTSHLCRWLGGTSSFINIDPNFANTANEKPDVRGNGFNDRGHLHIEVDTKKVGCGDGILMGIYHVYPLLDYSSLRLPRQNTRHYATDFAIPEFDRIGMEPVYLSELYCPRLVDIDGIPDQIALNPNTFFDNAIGYAPRYYDYKTEVDSVHTGIQTFDFRRWAAYRNNAFSGMRVTGSPDRSSYQIDMEFFKIKPEYADNIFFSSSKAYDPEDATPYESDHYLVDMFIKVYSSRPLDRNGLPY
ncbi:major capsid protein [Dipodfec virus UA23Rod_872]|uniref:Major capsid protein n=1 Tax=Dipodfec virus UA23Rod_872 TaxID=2929333 RepID=A0A976N2W4_9VIRU|nr:major capsid protein [Dipodfec virus UA23Rod_872]